MEHLLDVGDREEFREWLAGHHATARECWVRIRRGRPTDEKGVFWYLDAVEEALCFGWIDSTLKRIGGELCQRFAPRRRGGKWSELNKERCRRMERLGRMTDAGRAAYPGDMDSFVIDADIMAALQADRAVWENFLAFPPLYRRVRVDTIQITKGDPETFARRLAKLVGNTRRGVMYGEWNDGGRLTDQAAVPGQERGNRTQD